MPLLSRLANVFRSSKLNRDLDDELRFHIEERTAEFIRDGVPAAEAARQARRMLGSPLQTREASRDIKLLPRLESLVQDAQFGLRMLRKNTVVTAAAVVSLSLAVGACTAAFSLIDALILRPLPVEEPERLVYLSLRFDGEGGGGERDSFNYPLFERLREAGRGHVDLFGMSFMGWRRPAVFEGSGGQEEKVRCQFVSGDAFAHLGVKPTLGRVLTADDDVRPGDHPVAVISHRFWERRFGRDPGVLGRWVTVENRQLQIIGVAQEGFWGVEPGFLTDLWAPNMMWDTGALTSTGWQWFRAFGRLKPGVEPEQARLAMQSTFTNFQAERASTFPVDAPRDQLQRFLNAQLQLNSAANGRSDMRKNFERPLWILGLVAGLVLLIACSNVANLFIARAAAREREMALRVSIGAGRSRLVQQVLIESLLLAGAACILGLAFALAAAPAIVNLLSPSTNPAYLDLRIDWRVVGFVALLCALTTVLFGIAPALRASTVSPNHALKEGAQKHSSGMGVLRPLVSAQVGFSFVVLFLAGLQLLTFQKLTYLDPGFVKTGLIHFSIQSGDLKQDQYARGVAIRLTEQIRQLSGVEAASLSGWSLFEGSAWTSTIRMPGREPDSFEPYYFWVSPGFFETMGMRLLEGRDLEPRDYEPEEPTSVVVNEAFVRRYFPGDRPLGKWFSRLDRNGLMPQEIVGIVRDAKYINLREEPTPTVYVLSKGNQYGMLQVRTGLDPGALVATLREEIVRVHPTLRITGVTLQSTLIDNTLLRERLLALLSGFFAVVALVLAAVGLYGVLNYSVVRRTKEIGIRVALGARQLAVVRLVISEISMLIALGLAVGAAAVSGSLSFWRRCCLKCSLPTFGAWRCP